ncbi:hypothetical protein CLOM_g18343 [Closterium sp. NIES-68]|nr:hypothetical protein CLOM_g18343 [Closterium sp. NIES-68]GJP65825.1 hypothetical protein CLOP_g22740 [Closterium sp. NIES-67]
MSVPPMSAAAVAAFGGTLLEEPQRGIEIGGWRIECRHEPILTTDETEAWQASLSSQWLPEMVFGRSFLRVQHLATGVGVQFGALEALRGWKAGRLQPVKVPAAAAWGKRSRPSTDLILDYDYTFTTPYCGSVISTSSPSANSPTSNNSSTTTTHTSSAVAGVSTPLASRVADISISSSSSSSSSTRGPEGEEAVGGGGVGREQNGRGEPVARSGGGGESGGGGGPGVPVRAEGADGVREGEVEGAGEEATVVREVQAVWPGSAASTDLENAAAAVGGAAVAAAAPTAAAAAAGGGEGAGGREEGSKQQGKERGQLEERRELEEGEDRGCSDAGEGEWEAEWVACEGEGIDWAMLQRRDPILFSDEVVLYEDELADNGISLLTVRARVMPACWFILLRFWFPLPFPPPRVPFSRPPLSCVWTGLSCDCETLASSAPSTLRLPRLLPLHSTFPSTPPFNLLPWFAHIPQAKRYPALQQQQRQQPTLRQQMLLLLLLVLQLLLHQDLHFVPTSSRMKNRGNTGLRRSTRSAFLWSFESIPNEKTPLLHLLLRDTPLTRHSTPIPFKSATSSRSLVRGPRNCRSRHLVL